MDSLISAYSLAKSAWYEGKNSGSCSSMVPSTLCSDAPLETERGMPPEALFGRRTVGRRPPTPAEEALLLSKYALALQRGMWEQKQMGKERG